MFVIMHSKRWLVFRTKHPTDARYKNRETATLVSHSTLVDTRARSGNAVVLMKYRIALSMAAH
jgi:hypothetical protein